MARTKVNKKGTSKKVTRVADPSNAAKKEKAPCAKKSATPKAHRVAFTFQTEPGRKVFLAGSFNDWDPTAKQMTDKKNTGVFTATVLLAPGEYQYKFVVDGTWCADPENNDWVQNAHGTLNSVKHV